MRDGVVKKDALKGLLAIGMVAFLFGAAGALAKMLFTADISPVDLTAIRAIVACALFAVFLMITSRQTLRLTRDALPATIVGMLDPVIAGLFAFILIGETLTGGHMAGIALILLAIMFLTRSQGKEP